MASDGLVNEISVPTPIKGVQDGFEATRPEFDPSFAAAMDNLRCADGKVQTRKGSAFWKSVPGSGDIRLLCDHTESDGTRIRLAARGNTTSAVLYDYVEGVDSAFNSTTGGTGLGGSTEPYFQATTLGDRAFITDRNGPLKVYEEQPASGNQVRSVAQPAAPAAAPGVKARPYGYLEAWNGNSGAAPFGWTVSSSANYDITDGSSAEPAPGGGRTVKLEIKTGSAGNETIQEDVQNEAVPSNRIAYWIKQTRNRYRQAFEFGLVSDREYSIPNRVTGSPQDQWWPQFVDIGGIGTISFKQFRCVNSDASSDYISPLYLPGRLDGKYRWVYTHYDPATARESEPSAISNSGDPLDLSTVGVPNVTATANAFNKSAVLTFTSDSGTDSTTTKIRIYRQGGVPALTLDSNGREVWCRVGEVYDQSTTLNGATLAAATSLTVTSATNLAIGDTLVIDKGVANKEEYFTISNLVGTTVTTKEPLTYAHSNGVAIQVAFLDNVGNNQVDRTLIIQRERDDPPTGAKFVQKSPDGRLWLFGPGAKVAVSNRATPDRQRDYEVFPDGVDPLTRRDPLQGWRFYISGDVNDEQIRWGGFYQGRAVVLTQSNLYVVDALSQADWGPTSIWKAATVGCLCGDTVREIGGALYWVAEGPTIMRWDGQGQPEDISHQRVSERLRSAPSAYYKLWHAVYHPRPEGRYYTLAFVPSGATTASDLIELNLDQQGGAYEPASYYTAAGTKRAWRGASVRQGGSDLFDLYRVDTGGSVYQMETGSDDEGEAIRILWTTRKFLTDAIARLHSLYVRLDGVTDTCSANVAVGGSEYGEDSATYTLDLSGTGDVEIRQRLRHHPLLLGRWVQLSFSGSVFNRPALREVLIRFLAHRGQRTTL